MNKFLSMLLSTLLVIGLMPITAFGAINTIEVIENNDLVFYYNGTTSSYLKDVKDDIISNLIDQEVITTEDREEMAPIESIVDNFLFENKFSFVIGSNEDSYQETMYFMLDANLRSLTSVLDASKDLDISYETKNYNGLTIYYNDLEDLAITTLHGNVIIAPDYTTLTTIIDQYQSGQTSKLEVNSSTAAIFMSSQLLEELDPFYYYGNETLNAINSDISIKVYENNGSFTVISQSTFNESALNDLGLSLPDYQGEPSLYKSLPRENAAVYVEGTNILDFAYKLLNFGAETSNVQLNSEEASMLELLEGLSASADNNIALLIQANENGLIPFFTLAAEINSQVETQELLIELNNKLTNIITQNIPYPAVDNTPYLDESFVTMNLNEVLPNEGLTEQVDLSYGITKGNTLYVISNNPEIRTSLNEAGSLNGSTDFQNLLGQNLASENIVATSYVDLENSIKILENIFNSEVTDPEELAKGTDIFNQFKRLPSISSVSKLNGNTITETSKFELPASTLADIVSQLQQAFVSTNNILYPGDQDLLPIPPPPEFELPITDGFADRYTDLDESSIYNQWYGESLVTLDNLEIVQGSDNKFLPTKEMSRAEFITMLNRYFQLEGTTLGSDVFSDVSADAWYDTQMGIAYENGLITGDEGKDTARPLDLINRAEAVMMISNFSTLLLETNATGTTYTFEDVSTQDWFFDAAIKSYKLGIVIGRDKTTFAPYGKLTRGEAVVVIDRLRGSELANSIYFPELELIEMPEPEMEIMESTSEPLGALSQLWG